VITLIVVDEPQDWPLEKVPGVEVVGARSYLTDPAYNGLRGARIFNLCRSYRYQSLGYYVSLLAEARGHRPLPNNTTIQDLKNQAIARILSEDLDDQIQKSLMHLQSNTFTLSIYFGRNLAKRHDRLSHGLFDLFRAPLLRAQFARNGDMHWYMQSIRPIAASEIPPEHHDFVFQVACEHFTGRKRWPKRVATRYDLAILYDPKEKESPSNPRALRKFARAALKLGMSVDFITRDDYTRVAEYDALFIRVTTNVNHYTYRFARRAAAEGLIVIDDPDSILKCTNKVYLAELLYRHNIRTPKTLVVHKENIQRIVPELGLPCVLKQPDSSFSQGVVKAATERELATEVSRLLQRSEMVVAQEYLPTHFDWRVGVFDGQPLYVSKYFMAPKHWQIVKRDESGTKRSEGDFEVFAVEQAPPQLLQIALKAANLIGNGLYGVDLKQVGRQFYVIEINDNPSIDAGVEDRVLGDKLYQAIISVFLRRIERQKKFRASP
jgi:glutathione synthase/RimK-type ligase-like ATP-grasp enzyme